MHGRTLRPSMAQLCHPRHRIHQEHRVCEGQRVHEGGVHGGISGYPQKVFHLNLPASRSSRHPRRHLISLPPHPSHLWCFTSLPGGVGIARRDGRCGVCVSRWAEGAWVGGRRACDGRRSRASGVNGRGSHVVDMGCQLVECVVHKLLGNVAWETKNFLCTRKIYPW